jgi:hypothetical protein
MSQLHLILTTSTLTTKNPASQKTNGVVVTPIPVSSIVGLDIFTPSDQTWIRPELIFRQHWEQQHQQECWIGDADSSDDNHSNWHVNYCVVMTGIFTEFVVNGTTETCIHRVVAADSNQQRMSVPLFMRIREQMFATKDQAFNNNHPPQKQNYQQYDYNPNYNGDIHAESLSTFNTTVSRKQARMQIHEYFTAKV